MQIKPKFPRFCGSVRYRNAGRIPRRWAYTGRVPFRWSESAIAAAFPIRAISTSSSVERPERSPAPGGKKLRRIRDPPSLFRGHPGREIRCHCARSRSEVTSNSPTLIFQKKTARFRAVSFLGTSAQSENSCHSPGEFSAPGVLSL